MEGLKLTTTREGAVRFEVAARPRSKRSAIAGVREGALVVQLSAPPVDGAANADLLETVAQALGIPKRDVVLVRGDTSRTKLVEVHGLAEATVRSRLAAAAR